MNKIGASKGKVLVISLDENPEVILTDDNGFVLVFDTFKQISQYCFDNNIDLDSIIVGELDKLSGNVEEVEF